MTDIKKLERLLKTLGNRRRLSIVKYLSTRREASVAVIAEAINLSFKSTSHHLRLLLAAGILEKEQNRTTMLYSLLKPVSPILKTLLTML